MSDNVRIKAQYINAYLKYPKRITKSITSPKTGQKQHKLTSPETGYELSRSGPWMGNKDYVSREQGKFPHARAEIAHPVYIHLMGAL